MKPDKVLDCYKDILLITRSLNVISEALLEASTRLAVLTERIEGEVNEKGSSPSPTC